MAYAKYVDYVNTGAGGSPADFTWKTRSGLVASSGSGGAARLTLAHHAEILTRYEPGPVGFLQWLATAQPKAFANLKATHPQVLRDAIPITAALKMGAHADIPLCSGAGLSGLSSFSSTIGNWGTSLSKWLTPAVNLYGEYSQIKANAANATSGGQPVNYGGTANTYAPPASAVTSTGSAFSGSTGIMLVGGAAIVGVILFAALRKKGR